MRREPDIPGPDPITIDSTVEARFDDLVLELLGVEGVTPPGGGRARAALRFNGKIFAMLRGGRLVVKLQAARVDALVGDGSGVRFDPSKGTPWKEWLSLDPQSKLDWSALAREALEFACN